MHLEGRFFLSGTSLRAYTMDELDRGGCHNGWTEIERRLIANHQDSISRYVEILLSACSIISKDSDEER